MNDDADVKHKELLYYCHPELDLKYEFHPTDFVQINAAMNIKMINLVLEYLNLQEDDLVLDLFSGSGAMGLEAISRGVESAVFVDQYVDSIYKNIDAMDVGGRAYVRKGDVFKVNSLI